ncbi:hypothetical protein ACH5RR_027342 [Cinchona calisaya]|uniref:Uncharacterized protein n=1 Tax=Cinchona calisaya TaxID=153742 RepID=A0ABD2Z584_9GENT
MSATVDRTLWEIDPATNEAVGSDGDGETGSDLDEYTFGKMTLKQLKQKCKLNKRMCANSVGLGPQHGDIKLEPEDDESDLKVPLSSWKVKLPKTKKKCIRNSSESHKLAVSIKPEQGYDPERPLKFHGDLHLLIHVKTEVPELELKGCQNSTSFVDDTFIVNSTDESSLNQVISDGNTWRVECRSLEPDIDGEEYQRCVLNQVSYDHLENVESLCMQLPSFEEHMDVSYQDKRCHQLLDLPTSEFGREEQIEQPLGITLPSKDRSSDLNGYSRSYLHEFSMQDCSKPVVQVPDMVVDDSTSRKEPYFGGDSCLFLDSLNKKLTSNQQIATSGSFPRTSSSSWSPHPCSSTDEELLSPKVGETEEKQSFEGSIINRVNKNFSIGNHLDILEHELSSDKEKQPSTSTKIHAGDSSSCNQNCAFDETPSPSVRVQTPGRLLSTRKVISPPSQEHFCLAMNSKESCYDIDRQDCKVNLCDLKETETRFSCEESDNHGNASKIPKGPVAVSRTKFILSPSQIQRKAKYERTSPPKGNLEGPCLSRSLPRVTTGCTSVQDCSESAIAFSQRQMHDIESLAMKLMSELKSMKDIVEDKLLFEAYRNVSLKNDADEVKTAIANAIKAEELARKWLSMMGRDCTRFCKIMSLTQKGTTPAASTDVIQRERKRITFADEAGGILCHVKFFKNGMASLESNNVNQED